MPENSIPKPLPLPDDESAPFWEGAAEERLMLMHCGNCGQVRLPSRQHCDNCLSTEFTWQQASGRGTVRTFGVMHQRYHPGFDADLPYNVTVVELEEGPRITTNIIGTPNSGLSVGMAVTVAWEHHEDITLPKFRAS